LPPRSGAANHRDRPRRRATRTGGRRFTSPAQRGTWSAWRRWCGPSATPG
jgi:hypothetical protein